MGEPLLEKLDMVENLTDKAYKAIKDYIMSLPLNSKEKLSETTLADKLGISKTPVREALRMLANQGLIEIQPRRGTFLTEFTSRDIQEIFSIREYLEALAVNELFHRVDEGELSSLTEIAEAGHQASLKGDKQSYNEYDELFHKKLVALSGNQRLYEMFEKIHLQIHRVMAHSVRLPGRPDKSDNEHMQIIRALKEQDREGAERCVREHIQNVKHDLTKYFKDKQR